MTEVGHYHGEVASFLLPLSVGAVTRPLPISHTTSLGPAQTDPLAALAHLQHSCPPGMGELVKHGLACCAYED